MAVYQSLWNTWNLTKFSALSQVKQFTSRYCMITIILPSNIYMYKMYTICSNKLPAHVHEPISTQVNTLVGG